MHRSSIVIELLVSKRDSKYRVTVISTLQGGHVCIPDVDAIPSDSLVASGLRTVSSQERPAVSIPNPEHFSPFITRTVLLFDLAVRAPGSIHLGLVRGESPSHHVIRRLPGHVEM